MGKLFSVSEAARRLGVPARVLSDALYAHQLDPARCPLVGSRRVVPADYLPEVRRTLRRFGKLPARRATAKAS